MLQNNKTQSDIKRQLSAPGIVSGAETLQFFAGFLRRQFPVIAFVTLLAIVLGIVYIITARPSFTAQAQLLIDAQKVRMFQQQGLVGDLPVDTAQVESQVEVLKSENIALSVIKNLHLNEDPEFFGGRKGLLGTLFGLLFSPFASEQAPSEYELNRAAVSAFQNGLAVKRVGLSYVILINFRSHDPARAAEIANAVADAYVVDQLEAKYQATRRAGAWLQDRIKELREQVSTAERAVVDFKTKYNIVSTGGADKRLIGEQQVAELNSQLVIARANTAEAKARLDRIATVLNADSPNASVDATVADTLKSEIVTKLRSRYLELAARESEWSTKYGRDHLATVNLRNQMREIRTSIFDELKRLGETYKSDYEIAKQREVGVMKELAQAVSQSQSTSSSQVALRELESTAQTYKTIYDNFLQRYMESVQQQSFPISEARLISSASRPLQKSHPQTLLTLAIAGFGGLMFGFGIALLRDMSDRVFRTSEQVETTLQTDCISLVPLLTGDEAGEMPNDSEVEQGASSRKSVARSLFSQLAEVTGRNVLLSDLRGTVKSTRRKMNVFALGSNRLAAVPSPITGKPSKSNSRIIVRDDDLIWTVIDKPLSRYTEAMRSIKLVLDLNQMNKTSHVVGLTSALPNEGKSTIAIALGQLLSQAGKRTLVVDCDLRNPSLTRKLAPTATNGLLEVLNEKTSVEQAIWTEPSTKLEFLPAVVSRRMANSHEILNSAATKQLFEELRKRYDYVIGDFPPLAPIVDVRATAHLADSFIFVIEWGRTKIDVVEHALSRASDVYENLSGVVLNKVDMNLFGRYTSHHESYYYNKLYARYGYTE